MLGTHVNDVIVQGAYTCHMMGVDYGHAKRRLVNRSPGILGFEMEKNNIKLKISECVQNVLPYYL